MLPSLQLGYVDVEPSQPLQTTAKPNYYIKIIPQHRF